MPSYENDILAPPRNPFALLEYQRSLFYGKNTVTAQECQMPKSIARVFVIGSDSKFFRIIVIQTVKTRCCSIMPLNNLLAIHPDHIRRIVQRIVAKDAGLTGKITPRPSRFSVSGFPEHDYDFARFVFHV